MKGTIILFKPLTSSQHDAAAGFIEEASIPGAVVVVIHNRETRIGHFGFRDVEAGAPLTADTLFPLASVSKSFTATAVAMLATQGKLDLDMPVQRYLPKFKVADAEHSAAITVRMLLNHTSGLGRTLHLDPDAGASFRSRAELVEALHDYRLQTPPGFAYSYSNEAYSVAGHVVETVSGTEYEEFIETRILKPLGMERSTPRITRMHADDNRALGYALDETGVPRADEPLPDAPASVPAGRICSTGADIARYVAAVLNSDEHPLLPKRSLHAMQEAAPAWGDTRWGYGLGWTINDGPKDKVVRHGGNQRGVATHVFTVPAEGLGVAILTNLSRAPTAPIAEMVANATLGRPILRNDVDESLPVRTRYTTDGTRLPDFAGTYASHLGTLHVEAGEGTLNVIQRVFEPALEHRLHTVPVADDVFVIAHGGPEGQPLTFLRNDGGEVARVLLSGTPYTREAD